MSPPSGGILAKTSKFVPQHVLFRLCREAVGKASLAHTLAECLYWSQHATRKLDGRPAIWKTGSELADALGVAPKTANEHLKRLASLGFWDLEYRPRPHHPSPVSWLVFTSRAMEIVEAGRVALASKAPAPSTPKGAIAGGCNGALKEPHWEVQSCQLGTSKQIKVAPPQQPAPQKKFIPENHCSTSSKNELLSKKQKGTGSEKAPWYSKANPEIEELVHSIQLLLAEREMPEWDTSSQYTWKHAKALWGKLTKAGIQSIAEQVHFVSAILDDWPEKQKLMHWRYRNHSGNDARPTPMALSMEFAAFKDAVFPPPPPPPSSGNTFDDFF